MTNKTTKQNGKENANNVTFASVKQTVTEKASAKATKASAKEKPVLGYIERMHVAGAEMKNPSRLFRNLCETYGDVITGATFAQFLSYMKKRHNIPTNCKENPKRGWSVWFACQFAEQFARDASKDEKASAHYAACKYLRNERAEKQNAKTIAF